MSLYTIGDTHLSLAKSKPMDIFGDRWKDHEQKLIKGFSHLTDEDVTVICGDISWAMKLEDARADFEFIDKLPGTKYIVKGNHDYWFTTVAKLEKMFEEAKITTIKMLNNNCYFYGDYALCGTRGWFYEEETGSDHDKKIMNRELLRLETSLKAAGDKSKIAFLHYPPKYQNYECEEILELFEKYEVSECYYGHLHGYGCSLGFKGEHRGTKYSLVSADYVNFVPQIVL